jgi:hypothetical protein
MGMYPICRCLCVVSFAFAQWLEIVFPAVRIVSTLQIGRRQIRTRSIWRLELENLVSQVEVEMNRLLTSVPHSHHKHISELYKNIYIMFH